MSTMNRIANVGNPYQRFDKYPRVLAVCSAGLLRSPTIAWVLGNEPFNYNTRSVGSSKEYALIPIDDAHIYWADKIVFVSKEVMLEVSAKFDISDKEVHVLDIPDRFEYRDPKLVSILTEKFKEIFGM